MPAIETILYKEHRLEISLDTGETFLCAYSLLSSISLSSGMQLSPEAYSFIKEESELFLCREKAIGYLAIRQRSEFEMSRYLYKKEFSKSAIDATITFLRDKNYLNDFEFGLSYAASVNNRKPAGKPLLKQKLYQKGIKGKLADKVIKEAGLEEPDIDEIVELVKKKYRSLEGKPKAREKLYRFLMGRGFNYDTAKKALSYFTFDDTDED